VNKGIPRIIEAFLALAGLVVLSPFLGLGALLVALSSPGPLLYRQERIGHHGQKFILYKFRSMRVNSSDLQITAKNDDRITWRVNFSERQRLMNCQSWNVLRGDMFSWARPEVENMWILTIRCGDRSDCGRGSLIPLHFSSYEEELLGHVEGDPEQFYSRPSSHSSSKGTLSTCAKEIPGAMSWSLYGRFCHSLPSKAPVPASATLTRLAAIQDLRGRGRHPALVFCRASIE
jgi:hypothetical protein